MVKLLITCILIIALMILATFWMAKISHSDNLKTWQKVLSNACIIGFLFLVSLAFMIGKEVMRYSRIDESGYSLSKNPKSALKYLEDIEIDINLPDFKVKRHAFDFTGGSDTIEWWELEFIQPLSESFKMALDSLVSSNPGRWSYDKCVTRRGMSADEEEFYLYSYWNPKQITIQENVEINITANEATLIHRKI